MRIFNTGETEEELKNLYNPEGSKLRKMQLRMLDMLIYIDKVCKEQKIEWRLDGGNILGAVRHGGFIPWDDDIDIVLLPKEHKRLCDYLKAHPHPQYVLQDHDTDPGFYAPKWAVLRDTKSEYIQNTYLHNARKYRGAQIDIFCYNNHINKPLYKVASKFTSLNIKYFIGRHNHVANWIFYLQIYLINPMCHILGYYFSPSNRYGHDYGHEASPFQLKHVSHDMIYPLKPILFEGHYFPGPGDVDKFLRFKYGEYMLLPPKENRNHHQAEYNIWD